MIQFITRQFRRSTLARTALWAGETLVALLNCKKAHAILLQFLQFNNAASVSPDHSGAVITFSSGGMMKGRGSQRNSDPVSAGAQPIKPDPEADAVEEVDSCGAPMPKRTKLVHANNENAAHFTCPLTLELILEPVVAKDGQMYEKDEIVKWIRSQPAGAAHSPINPSMVLTEDSLNPVPMIKQVIKNLVDSGGIDAALVEAYNARELALQLEVAKLKYEEGDIKGAAEMGYAKAQGKMSVRCHKG